MNGTGPFRLCICAFFLQSEPIAAFSLAALAELKLISREELLSGEEQSLHVTRFELEFCLADFPCSIACAHFAVVDGEFDFAVLGLDRARRALDDRLEDRLQGGSLSRLLHGPLDLLVGDLREIRLRPIDRRFELDRIREAAVNMLVGLYRLQPAAILPTQPQGNPCGM